jgi:hypothetical protein
LAGLIVACAAVSSCAPQYREPYEADARMKAADTCKAAGISINSSGYYACFQAHLSPLMASAPTLTRPSQITDQDVCGGYGFQPGTDAFAACLQKRDEQRQQIIRNLILSR